MITYLVLDLIFIITVLICDIVLFKTNVWRRRITWITFGILLVFTLVFNTILTALPIVEYDYAKLLGIYIGTIPLEDLSYTLVAVILIPLLKEVIHE